jgi:pyridoxamine 5'-phosphate oxidase
VVTDEPDGLDFSALRTPYPAKTLERDELAADPITQFKAWLSEAFAGGLAEANAMTLATADADGRPSARTVLLKAVDERGFVFYTNRESVKGRQLGANPYAALVFHWQPLGRQVCVVGEVTRTSDEDSNAYFATRPRGSQLAAWASPQSRPVADRDALERRMAELSEHYGDNAIPRPDDWGGLTVSPESVEFWQGRRDRLHDRLTYRREDGGWRIERLGP